MFLWMLVGDPNSNLMGMREIEKIKTINFISVFKYANDYIFFYCLLILLTYREYSIVDKIWCEVKI